MMCVVRQPEKAVEGHREIRLVLALKAEGRASAV